MAAAFAVVVVSLIVVVVASVAVAVVVVVCCLTHFGIALAKRATHLWWAGAQPLKQMQHDKQLATRFCCFRATLPASISSVANALLAHTHTHTRIYMCIYYLHNPR